MHPTFRHVPPSSPASTSTVSSPSSPARIAVVYPPGPPPSTRTAQWSSVIRAGPGTWWPGARGTPSSRWTKLAASHPSMIRWSNPDDRFIIVRGTNALPSHTGRICILLTPTTATSGWLMTGVVTRPPSAPSDVTVIVEPTSSSRPRLPSTAAVESRLISAREHPEVGRLCVANDWYQQTAWVCVAMPTWTAPYCRTMPASSSNRALTSGCSATEQTIARTMKGSRVSVCVRRAVAFVERSAEPLDLRDVDLLDVGDVGDARLRRVRCAPRWRGGRRSPGSRRPARLAGAARRCVNVPLRAGTRRGPRARSGRRGRCRARRAGRSRPRARAGGSRARRAVAAHARSAADDALGGPGSASGGSVSGATMVADGVAPSMSTCMSSAPTGTLSPAAYAS